MLSLDSLLESILSLGKILGSCSPKDFSSLAARFNLSSRLLKSSRDTSSSRLEDKVSNIARLAAKSITPDPVEGGEPFQKFSGALKQSTLTLFLSLLRRICG